MWETYKKTSDTNLFRHSSNVHLPFEKVAYLQKCLRRLAYFAIACQRFFLNYSPYQPLIALAYRKYTEVWYLLFAHYENEIREKETVNEKFANYYFQR